MEKSKHSLPSKILYRINMFFIKFEEIILGILFLALLSIMVIQVTSRYVFYVPTPWAEELSIYIYIWIAYIGGAYVTFYWDHIEIDIINSFINKFSKKPRKVNKVIEKISIILTVIFILLLANIYKDFLFNIWELGQSSSALKISMVVPMSSVLIGSLLMIFHGISLLFLPKSIIKPPSWKKEE